MYTKPVLAQPVVSLTKRTVWPEIGAGLRPYNAVLCLVMAFLNWTVPVLVRAANRCNPRSAALLSKSLLRIASTFSSSRMLRMATLLSKSWLAHASSSDRKIEPGLTSLIGVSAMTFRTIPPRISLKLLIFIDTGNPQSC